MSDIEALIARGKEMAPKVGDVSDGRVAMMINDLAFALESSPSPTPIGDAAISAILGTLAGYDLHATQKDQIITDLIAAGFRVTPEPVYEYSQGWPNLDGQIVVGGTFHSAKEAEQWIDADDHEFLVRRVKAGEWERLPVVSTSKDGERNE